MVRTIIAAIYVLFFFIISLPYLGITWLIKKLFRKKMDIYELRFVQWGFSCVNRIAGHKIIVNGMENIPADTPVLFVGNHRGFFDIIATYSIMPGLTGFVAKIGIKKVPVLSFIMERIHCLFIDNSSHKQSLKVILQICESIKNGISIFIYPEGKRNRNDIDWELLPMHHGSFKPAQRTKCPIIPVAVSHSDRAFEKQFPKIVPTKIIITFGKPFFFSDIDESTIPIEDHTSQILSEMLRSNEEIQ